jgi:hypothetical protein
MPNMRLVTGLGVLLCGLLTVGLVTTRRQTRTEAEQEAWHLLAPGHTVHHCSAPPSEVYRSLDLSYLHVTPRGLGMATLAPSGETTLLDALAPIGTLRWSPEGCSVGQVTSRTVTVSVVDLSGAPVQGAYVASCYWLDLARTDALGRVTLTVPPSVRCKLAASAVEGESFWTSPPVALTNDLSEVTLTLGAESRTIVDQRRDLSMILDSLGNRSSKTSYDRAIESASPEAARVLGTWKEQYRARQKAALTAMRGFLDDGEDGWLRLSR